MDPDNKRDLIISELNVMAQKETVEKNFFKVRAYKKVIDQIKLIESVYSMDDLVSVSGIGEKIRAKLEEIFKTGKLRAAERAREKGELKIYDIFLKIHGIGVVKAKELIDHGIDTIEKLTENQDLLNETQRIGLKYYLDTQLRIPRKEMEKHARKLSKLTRDIDPDLELKVVGSYRRGAEDSGDIDVLVTIHRETNSLPKILKKIVDTLRDNGYLLADLSNGQKKYMGIARLNKKTSARRIDILMTSQKEYPFALVYFTGDFQINISLRKRATELGYTLNEYTLRGAPKELTIESEKELFNVLGFKFLKPKDRTIQNLKDL